MPKSSNEQIEKDEKKILEELKINANKSINDIAKTCGFSRQKVWRIVKNLEKNNTIWGYTAILDNQKLGKKRYQMLLKRSHQPVTKELLNHILDRKLKEKAKEMGVEYIDSIYANGYYDWILTFLADDLKSAKKVVELYKKLYEGLFSEIRLNEELFVMQKCGMDNPEIEKLKDFF